MNPRVLAAGLLVVGLILLDVRQHVRIVSLGYEVESLGKERDRMKNRNRELLIEAESLSALDRIEGIAMERLGMIRPEENQIRIIPSEGDNSPAEGSSGFKMVRTQK